MGTIYLSVALIAYIVGIFFAILTTTYQSRIARNAASVFWVIAWSAHTVAVVHRGVATGGVPLSSGPEYLLFLGLAVMTLHLLVWFRWRVDVVGIFLPPVAGLTGFVALALLGAGTAQSSAPHGWFLFHTTVSTLGMATLVVAFAMSVIYLVQDRALKARRTLQLLDRLPSLNRCDSIGFNSLVFGFILLTMGIGTGVIVNASVHDSLWIPGLKQTLPVSSRRSWWPV